MIINTNIPIRRWIATIADYELVGAGYELVESI